MASASLEPFCSDVSSVSISAIWPSVPDGIDLVYLGLFDGLRAPRPFALQTATRAANGDVGVTVIDLLPNTTYTFRWRSHPANTHRNIGWYWRPYEPPFTCTTKAVVQGAASNLHRVGPLQEDSVTVGWRRDPSSLVHSVGIRSAPHLGPSAAFLAPADFTFTAVAPNESTLTLRGLVPGESYEVVVVSVLAAGGIHGRDTNIGPTCRANRKERVRGRERAVH